MRGVGTGQAIMVNGNNQHRHLVLLYKCPPAYNCVVGVAVGINVGKAGGGYVGKQGRGRGVRGVGR